MTGVEELLDGGEIDKALEAASRDDIELLSRKALELMEIDDEGQLVSNRIFRRIIELEPSSLAAHNNLGVLLFRQGKYPEARKEYKQAIDVGIEEDKGEVLGIDNGSIPFHVHDVLGEGRSEDEEGVPS